MFLFRVLLRKLCRITHTVLVTVSAVLHVRVSNIFIVIGWKRARGSDSKSARASVTRSERVCRVWACLRRKNENEYDTEKTKKKVC